MRRNFGLLLCLGLLLASTLSWASALETPLGLGNFAQSRAHLQIHSPSPALTSLTLENPEIEIQETLVDYQSYQSFEINGENLVYEQGKPAVPQVTRLYRIPNTGSVELVIRAAEYEVVDNINAMPIQLQELAFGQLRRDEGTYRSDAWYPAEVAVLSDPMIMRDFRIAQVTLYPVQVNPATGQARIYRNLQVDVVANDQPGINELTLNRRPSARWASIYRQVIANLDESALDELNTSPGSILVLCKDAPIARTWADSFMVWKTRRGIKTVIDARNNWDVNSMQAAVRTAYRNFDPPLEYVCLIGDPQNTVFGVPTNSTGYGGELDHWFARADGNDRIEDVGVGRLSGASDQEMAIINAKLMNYERTPFMGTPQNPDTMWYHRAFSYAGISHTIASNYVYAQWVAQQLREWTEVDSVHVATHEGQVNNTLIAQQFNLGISYYFWRGGYVGEMYEGVVDGMNNGFKLPIGMLVTCSANNFEGGVGIAERHLTAGTSTTNVKGCVATIGTSTSGTHSPQNITFAGGLAFSIINANIEHLGHALNAAKIWLGLTYGFGDNDTGTDFMRWNNLMGDPSLSMWNEVPKVLTVTHPLTLNVGARRLPVTVVRAADNTPVADATVCAWKRGTDSTWVVGTTDSEGELVLPINVRLSGDLFLTITKRNHKPYLATLPCLQAEYNPMPATVTIDDDNNGGSQGNGDHLVNPGEIIDLPLYICNYGNGTTATGVSATISSDNPNVTVVQATSTYPNIAPGDSVLGATPFRVQVSTLLQNEESTLLTVNITTTSGNTVGAIELRGATGEILYVSQNSTTPLNPGATGNLAVSIRNISDVAMTGVTAQLISQSPYLQVVDGNASYPDIPVDSARANTADRFVVSANPLAFRGYPARLLLVTTTANGGTDSLNFTVTLGDAQPSDPTGPDAFGYFAYDNTDVSYEMAPGYNYINISSGLGQNLNINDTGEKLNINNVWSVARPLPFPFKFYGEVHDSITICSNGWCAFGNQAWNDNFRNMHIPATLAPQYMIAPYWDDLCTSSAGCGVWTYFQPDSHRFIIQWKTGWVNSQSSCEAQNLDFEVILYDTLFHPTFDGNGRVLIQYNQVVENSNDHGLWGEAPGFSVGIQDKRGTTGLAYHNYFGTIPGTAPFTTGRAILFSTDARMMFGDVEGQVTDAATNQPMPGVDVSLDGFGYHALTDAQGHYLIENVLIGTYDMRARKYRYNDATVADQVVLLDETITVNLTMTHPLMTLSTDAIQDTIGDEPTTTSFEIINNGNGELDYDIVIRYAGDENPEPWDSVGAINVSDQIGDRLIMGCEFAGDFWYVSGGNGPDGQNVLYKFDLEGNAAGYIPQPTTSNIGWFDLAYDPENHLIFGSDGPQIVGIDLEGNVEVTLASPMNPSRALAYDPAEGHFWVGDYTQDIFEIDLDGNVVQQIPNQGTDELMITGLAWYPIDADGYNLYIFSQNGAGQTRISRMHPITHDIQFVVDVNGQTGDRAGGCTVTGGWNSALLVFGGIIQNGNGDRLEIFEMDFNTTWIEVAPAAFTVPGGGTRNIEVRYDPETLRPGTYEVDLFIHSNVYDTTMVLPVALTLAPVAADEPLSLLPSEFNLYQNYPNPFNPSTQIRFDLAATASVKLEIFNALGQRVATLLDENRPAGTYSVVWNGRSDTGLDVASGLYFFRLQAADFVSVKKMLLMK